MYKTVISQLAQAVMILSSEQEGVERDTVRLIMEEEGYSPDGSYEQVAQIVEECSMVAKLDVLNFWEQAAFGWVVGLQMGYDDFALYSPHKGLYALSPIFTFDVCMESEQSDLTLNGKSRGVSRADFEVAMKRSGIRAKIIGGVFARLAEALPKWYEIIESSELSDKQKTQYKNLLATRVRQIV